MPLQISEIAVRLAVSDAPAQLAASAGKPGQTAGAKPLSREQIDEIVRACVAETLTLIRIAESR